MTKLVQANFSLESKAELGGVRVTGIAVFGSIFYVLGIVIIKILKRVRTLWILLFPSFSLVISHLVPLLSPNPPSQHCRQGIWELNFDLLWNLKSDSWGTCSGLGGAFLPPAVEECQRRPARSAPPPSPTAAFKRWRMGGHLTDTSIILALPRLIPVLSL